MAFIPASFFIILGIVAILFTQGAVKKELESLGRRSLGQVRDGLELIFNEADSLALSLSTDPEFTNSLEYSLKNGVGTLPDLKLYRSIQSTIASAVNSRRYLHSISAVTPNGGDLFLSSSEGSVSLAASMDSAWLEGVEAHAGGLEPWTTVRNIRPFPSLSLSIPVLSFYRNLIGSGTLARKGVLAANIDLRYLDNLLSTQAAGGESGYVLLDRLSGAVIAGQHCTPAETERLLGMLGNGNPESLRKVSIGSSAYLAASSASARFPFAYFILTPEVSFYRLTRMISLVTLVFALVALAIGTLLTVAMTRRNFRLLDGIMDIVDAAGSGEELPAFHESRNEALNFLTFSILKTFVEHDYFRIRLREREYRQKTLELTALQAQMNPHFLFNTLTTIGFKAMASTGGPNDMTRMVELLSSILRYALSDPRSGVTLGEEIAHTKNYCAIQEIRFGARFSHTWDVDESLLALPCIRLMIQPLVENALEHGFGGGMQEGIVELSVKRKTGGGQTVPSGTEGAKNSEGVEMAVVQVADNGCGISDEAIREVEARIADEDPASDHVGLANTVKRLVLTYGGAAFYAIGHRDGGGTVVTLAFPARLAPDSAARIGDSGRSTDGMPG